MSVAKVAVVTCDGLDFDEPNPMGAKRCDAMFTGEPSEPRDVVIHRARNTGWSVADGGAWHYCPTHTTRETS